MVRADAADYEFPNGNLLVFLYNPFDSVILKRVFKIILMQPGVVSGSLSWAPDTMANQESGIARLICSGDGPTIYEIVKGSNRDS